MRATPLTWRVKKRKSNAVIPPLAIPLKRRDPDALLQAGTRCGSGGSV